MASIFDTTNIKVFDNKILEQRLENQLITALDMNQFITVDESLAANPGMTVTINKYVGTGNVEDLEMGEGNTGDIGAEFTSEEYKVGVTQGRVPYFDEQQMNDPVAIDKALQFLSEQLTNDLTVKIVAEFDKATNVVYGATFDFATIVEAIASMPGETSEGLFILINKKDYATIQKDMKDTLQYVEAFARTGYVGSVAGAAIYITNGVAEGTVYIATKDAVTAFVKKGVELETERDANTRKTTLYGRKVMVVALTDDRKVVKITTAEDENAGV